VSLKSLQDNLGISVIILEIFIQSSCPIEAKDKKLETSSALQYYRLNVGTSFFKKDPDRGKRYFKVVIFY
jgi:hypothetical protein